MVDSPRLVFIHIFIEEIFKEERDLQSTAKRERRQLTVIVDGIVIGICAVIGACIRIALFLALDAEIV